MKITSVALSNELTDRIDQVARDSERSRSYVVRKLLENSLTGADRLRALESIAATELEASNTPRERAPNASALIAESCPDGRARLEALKKIAAANGAPAKEA
jgi:predicted transcriptional regulator